MKTYEYKSFFFLTVFSYPPARCTSEFVRKQLQSTIHGRQKTTGGKDASTVVTQKSMQLCFSLYYQRLFTFNFSDESIEY